MAEPTRKSYGELGWLPDGRRRPGLRLASPEADRFAVRSRLNGRATWLLFSDEEMARGQFRMLCLALLGGATGWVSLSQGGFLLDHKQSEGFVR